MKKSLASVHGLLIIYFFLSISSFFIWRFKGENWITGDEVHYLIMASGIIKHGTFEQTIPYSEEFNTQEIVRQELAPEGAIPTNKNTHAIQGPHGLFNIHNIGLPLIISIPFLVNGVFGVKIFMIALGGMAIIITWKITGFFSSDRKIRFFTSLVTCVALPLIPASNQIYPDLLAGIIALCGIYWFITTDKQRNLIIEGIGILAIVFLPWLQIKFLAPCIILVIAIGVKTYIETKSVKKILLFSITTITSLLLLGLYNSYAFGRILGPYDSSALELSKTSFMVFFGLLFDQNQGFIFQNPITIVGIFFIGTFFLRNKSLLFLVLLVFLSFLVPNCMHTVWYGGYSFSGRFEWSIAILFILPTVFGLITLSKTNKRLFWLIIGIALLLQSYFFYRYTFTHVDLFNKVSSTSLDMYSMFFSPVQSWLPALYNVSWAFNYLPNYIWFTTLLIILILGILTSGLYNKLSPKL